MKRQESAMAVKEEKRIEWADVTKSFAIWLMVFAHANLSNETLMCMIYTFHMPLFFILSGFFDKGKGLSLSFLKKNFQTLIIPYFIYSILGLSICWISPYVHPELYYGMDNLTDIFKAAIKGMFLMEDKIRPTSFMPIGCLWFLPALFLCKTMWSSILSCLKCKIPFFVILPLGVFFAAYYFHPIYFSVDSAALGLPLYGVGFLMKKYQVVDKYFSNNNICIFTFILLILYVYYWGIRNGRVDMDGCNPGYSIWLFYINAIIGTISCICLAKVFSRFEYLQRIGTFSLTILALHPFVIYASKAFSSYFLNTDMSNMPVWGSAMIACISCVSVVTIKSRFNLKWLK